MMPMPPPRTTPLTADEIARIERGAATLRSLSANATDPALREICGALADLLSDRTITRKERPMHNAILIDPYSKTIEPRTLGLTQGSGGYRALRDAVFPTGKGSRLICYVNLGPVPRVRDEPALTLSGYVDDEGMLVDWDNQAFFRIGPASETGPLAGRMIVVCADEAGEFVGVPTFILPHLLHRLHDLVTWLDPRDVRVPAPSFQPLGPDLQPEGEPTPLTPDGRSEWDYDHQPR